MPKKVDVDERKEIILNTALRLFAKEGYKDTNLSQIAEESGISRPTVYQYFHDKNDIYYYAVKLVTGKMFSKYSAVAWADDGRDEIDKILFIIDDVLGYAASNSNSISNLMEYMIAQRKRGVDFAEVIEKRTAKLTILIKRLIRKGIANGTIIPCSINDVSRNVFNLIESCCFQVGIYQTFDKDSALALIRDYLGFYRA